MRTQVAPIVSLIGLVGFVLLALTNLGALTGSEGWDVVNIIILATLVVSFLVGALGAAFMMAKAPSRFNSIIGAA